MVRRMRRVAASRPSTQASTPSTERATVEILKFSLGHIVVKGGDVADRAGFVKIFDAPPG